MANAVDELKGGRTPSIESLGRRDFLRAAAVLSAAGVFMIGPAGMGGARLGG